jgi:histidine triad (HIT) family protein
MTQCLFCKIANGQTRTSLVYADPDLVAFHDLNPQAPTHLLIIPRRHLATLNDFTEADAHLLGRLFLTGRRLADELGFADEGYRLVTNCNANAGQSVYHFHVHLLAGRLFRWPPG